MMRLCLMGTIALLGAASAVYAESAYRWMAAGGGVLFREQVIWMRMNDDPPPNEPGDGCSGGAVGPGLRSDGEG